MNISEKLARVGDRFEVTQYDNGFLVEVSGQTANDDWANARIMVHEQSDVIRLFEEYASMPNQE